MRAALVPALFFLGFVFALGGTARASNPFCGGSVWILPWNVGADAPLALATSADYGIAIVADGKTDVAARVTLITDADAWSVEVPRGALRTTKGGDAVSHAFLVHFESAKRVRYAYVDAVGVDGAAVDLCPSVVRSVEPYDGKAEVHLGNPEVLKPTFLQKLPPLACSAVYTPPNAKGIGGISSSYGNVPRDTVVRVYVDSNGIAAKTELVTSSGVEGLDTQAVGLVQTAHFTPATFLCTPVVGEMDITVHYH